MRLARRDHASEELRRKLLDQGYDSAVVEALIERLRAEKLARRSAAIWRISWPIMRHAATAPSGCARICASSGLQGAQVEDRLDAYPDWIAQLQRARQKKFGTSLPSNYADRQRQARFLGYRGFTRRPDSNGLRL